MSQWSVTQTKEICDKWGSYLQGLRSEMTHKHWNWKHHINIQCHNIHAHNARELPLVSMLEWDVFHSAVTLTRFVALRHSQPAHEQTDENKDGITAFLFGSYWAQCQVVWLVYHKHNRTKEYIGLHSITMPAWCVFTSAAVELYP